MHTVIAFTMLKVLLSFAGFLLDITLTKFINCYINTFTETKFNPFTPKISSEISLLSVLQFLGCYFREFGIGSINNPVIDIFL